MSAPDLSPAFYDAWVAMAARLGVDPLDIARVAYAETGILQRATDPRSNAGGIFPFMPSTLRRLGWTGTPEEFRELSPRDQIPWVERYLAPYAPYLKNDGLVYLATFTPAYLADGANEGDGFVIARQGSKIYDQNTILDRNGDGAITVGDLRQHLLIMDRGARYDTIDAELRARGGGGRGGAPAPGRASFVPLVLALGLVGAYYLYATDDGAAARRRATRTLSRYGVPLP